MRAMKLSVTIAAAAVLMASEAHAQACTGVPTRDRQLAAMGNVSLTDGATGYGADMSANLRGPLSFSAGYTLMNYDAAGPNGNGVNADAAYELNVPSLRHVSVCPTIGVQYAWVSDAGDKVSSTAIPIGLGFGKNVLDKANFDVLAFAVPQFMHVRSKIESATLGFDATSSDNAFGSILGARFVGQRVFGGASVSLNTLDNSSAVWGFTVGFVFGGHREPVQASRSKAASTKASGKSAAKSSAKPASKSGRKN